MVIGYRTWLSVLSYGIGLRLKPNDEQQLTKRVAMPSTDQRIGREVLWQKKP